MTEDLSAFETIRTQRAIRRFSNKPVPQEAITRIVEAATRAPSPGNRQSWHFLVIRDQEVKRRIGEYYWRATVEMRGTAAGVQPASSATHQAADELAQHIGEVPVLILVCVDARPPGPASRGTLTQGAAIYPAIQNLMLAARSLGLGTCLTTRYRYYEEEVKALLGIPANVETAALIPVGYPGEGKHFGGGRRMPVAEVTFYDRWGNQAP